MANALQEACSWEVAGSTHLSNSDEASPEHCTAAGGVGTLQQLRRIVDYGVGGHALVDDGNAQHELYRPPVWSLQYAVYIPQHAHLHVPEAWLPPMPLRRLSSEAAVPAGAGGSFWSALGLAKMMRQATCTHRRTANTRLTGLAQRWSVIMHRPWQRPRRSLAVMLSYTLHRISMHAFLKQPACWFDAGQGPTSMKVDAMHSQARQAWKHPSPFSAHPPRA